VVKKQLFVNGVVAGVPVISNQNELPGRGYTWRVQIPFLVSYQSSDQTTTERYIVVMMIVKVPTTVNPEGIGIDQFAMMQ
jgi:intracellular multiplication protein IcmL